MNTLKIGNKKTPKVLPDGLPQEEQGQDDVTCPQWWPPVTLTTAKMCPHYHCRDWRDTSAEEADSTHPKNIRYYKKLH
jgi:hypothetical protein